MTNLSFTFPSTTTGAVLDVKKGRSSVSFTRADLQFLADIFETIEMNDFEEEDEYESGLLVEATAEVDKDEFFERD